MLSEIAKSWIENVKTKLTAIRQSVEWEREKMWLAEQKRRRASLEEHGK
jgi:hypothetical protein